MWYCLIGYIHVHVDCNSVIHVVIWVVLVVRFVMFAMVIRSGLRDGQPTGDHPGSAH